MLTSKYIYEEQNNFVAVTMLVNELFVIRIYNLMSYHVQLVSAINSISVCFGSDVCAACSPPQSPPPTPILLLLLLTRAAVVT